MKTQPSIEGIADKKVLVTGASRGLGFGIAKGFQAAGAELHVLADDPKIIDVAAALGAAGHLVDITSGEDTARVMATIGRLNVLVNNAGLERITPLDDASVDAETIFRRIIDINVVGTYLMTRAAVPLMPAGSVIINTASVWSRGSEANFSAYVSSKHATIGLTKTWAKELGPKGIRVNAVCPGWVRTKASMLSLKCMAERAGRSETEILDGIVGAQILPRLMEPDDIAGPYLFLASDLALNITGQSLGVDRGEFPW